MIRVAINDSWYIFHNSVNIDDRLWLQRKIVKRLATRTPQKKKRGWNVMLNSILYGTHFVLIRFNKLLKTMISKWLFGADFGKCMMKLPKCYFIWKKLCLRHTILSYIYNKYIHI